MKRRAGLLRRHLGGGLAVLIGLALIAGSSRAADVTPRELRGACYCRAQRELMCTADLTARECELHSTHAFCDEWFWKERLPCWNWGYGG